MMKNMENKEKRNTNKLHGMLQSGVMENLDKMTDEQINRRMEQLLSSNKPDDVKEYNRLAVESEKRWSNRDDSPKQLTEIEKAREYSTLFPQETQPQTHTQSSKENITYKCKCHGLTFPTFHALGNHVRRYKAQQRRLALGRSQFTETPKNIPKKYKHVKVEHMKQTTRIISTTFIPASWDIVRIHAPVQKENGVWVYFEPLSKGAD
jgi:hypothetical protein